MTPAVKPPCACEIDLAGKPGIVRACGDCGQRWRAYPGERVRCVWDRVTVEAQQGGK